MVQGLVMALVLLRTDLQLAWLVQQAVRHDRCLFVPCCTAELSQVFVGPVFEDLMLLDMSAVQQGSYLSAVLYDKQLKAAMLARSLSLVVSFTS